MVSTVWKRRLVYAVAAALLLAAAGCATIQEPHRGNLAAADKTVQDCARWFKALDAAVAESGVADISARRVAGFPYLRTDRFTAAMLDSAAADAQVRQAWIDRMRLLGADGFRVEIVNMPVSAMETLPVSGRDEAIERSLDCAERMAAADVSNVEAAALLDQRAHVDDDYSTAQRTFGLYYVTRVPFYSGIQNWHEEAIQTFAAARAGEPPRHPVMRYVPPAGHGYTRQEVVEILDRAAGEPLGIPQLSESQIDRLFATYAPVLEVETTGDFDRVGKLYWSGELAPQVDLSQPTVYRKLAYTRVGNRTLLQLVYVVWMPERPKDGTFDMLGGTLDGIVWRVTLAPDGEPALYDSIHPCGCFHMFFPTPRVEPVPAPAGYVEWAFAPATLPANPDASRIIVSAQTRTHYLRNVWFVESVEGVEYAFADYDELRTLPLPAGGSRSAFGPDGLVPGTQRSERLVFWPMGIASAGAMRQWGTHATAFVGRRHFDDADLIDKRYRLLF